MSEIPVEWLERINVYFAEQEMPQRARPWNAIAAWSAETGHQVDYVESPEARFIFAWFESQSIEGAQSLPPLYTSVAYFDATFWPMEIPLAYGMVCVEFEDCLSSMPRPVLVRLAQAEAELHELKLALFDALDYGFGFNDLELDSFPELTRKFLRSLDQQLRSAAALLLERPHNPKSIEAARFTVEIALKVSLARHRGFTEDQLRKRPYGHDLQSLFEAVVASGASPELTFLREYLGGYPDVGARYEGTDWPPRQLWNCFKGAQLAAAATMRELTGRNASNCVVND